MSKKNLQEETIKTLIEADNKQDWYYYEIHFDFTEESGKDSDGYSKFFKSKEDVDGDYSEEVWNLAIAENVIGDEDDFYDVDYTQQIDKDEYERATMEKVEEDVTPDREYKGIKYFDNQDGYCPVCNAQLHYQPVEYAGDDVVYYGWDCDKCGAKGEAYFKQSFIGHSVYDDNFDLIELPFDEVKTEGKKTEAKLEDIQMEIYEMIQTARKVDKQDKDTNIKETLNAIRLTYPEINRDELKDYITKKADEIYAGEYDEKTESKKVEAIDKEKVLNMKYADLPDMCYGLLPSDNSVIIIKKGEKGYYKTDYGIPENPEEFVAKMNEKLGVTPEQRMVMELRSMSGNWVLPNEGDKKVEDVNKLNNMYEQGTTELERAFTTEVKYWLQALIDDNPNDEVGVQALNVIDDESKVKEIVDELVNGSDDLWEAIHLKIEQLAGIDYRNSTRGKVESKKIKEDIDEENSLDDIANYIKGIVDYNVSITPTGKGFSSYDVNFLNTDDSIMYSVMVNDDAIKDKVRLLNTLVLELKRLYNGKTFADGIREDLLNELNKIHPVDKKVTEAYNYNWKDDIEEVDNTEANDELAYEFAENLIATDPDYADYDDPWDVLSQIICIWKITKRSRLYDYLLKWYGSEEEMKKHIRSFYETSDAIYFETGIGYSIFSADLLGGTADGMAEKEFDAFISNGGKRVK